MWTGCATSCPWQPPRGDRTPKRLPTRLTAPLESAIRLALLEALSEAAEQITRDLAPGSVEVRLRGRDPEFTVSSGVELTAGRSTALVASESEDDGGTWRVTLRLPENLRAGVDAAARGRRAVGERLAGPGGRPPRWGRIPLGAPAAHQTSPTAAGSADHHTDKRRRNAQFRYPPTHCRGRGDRRGSDPARRELIATDTVVEVRPRDESRPSRRQGGRAGPRRLPQRHACRDEQSRVLVSAQGSGRSSMSHCRKGPAWMCRSRRRRSRADGRVRRLQACVGERRLLAVESVAGNIKADTASGAVAVDVVKGAAVIATASGDATIGDLDGDVKFRAASGSLTVRRLHGNVNAQTASGDVTVATAVNGGVSVQTSSGELVVGIAEGTAAQLDLRTGSGEVRNSLTPSGGPADGDETLVVHARTGSGDVVVQRATAEAMS